LQRYILMSQMPRRFLRTTVLFHTAISLEMQVFFGLEKVNRARQAQVGFYKLKRRI
jgi:hypothetical protein